MGIEQLFEKTQQFHNIDDLIQKVAANKGVLSGIAISEHQVVKEAEALGMHAALAFVAKLFGKKHPQYSGS